MNVIKVPQLAWHETKELELPVPDSWQVEVYNMAGYNRPALKPDEIRASVSNPIGMPPIRELAKGRKEVVIMTDDTTRGTRAAEIVPFVLEELAAADIPDDRIRFIIGFGMHGALDRLDLIKKLGEEVVARFPVYNHNPFSNCTYVGTTSTYKTEVFINEEVMACDLKIAIDSVIPHSMAGFGGGGKIILPGVSSFETIKHNHQMMAKTRQENRDNPITGMGIFDGNPMRADVDEAADLVGLDVLISCTVNTWGEIAALFTGAMKPAYAAAVREAKTHYLTPTVRGMDIVIANLFTGAKQPGKGLPIAYPAVRAEGGDVVLIANSPEGPCTHYLGGGFGKTIQAKRRGRPGIPRHIDHLITYTEYPDAKWSNFEEPDRGLLMYRWDDVLELLQKSHGADTKVAVYPNAESQYCTG